MVERRTGLPLSALLFDRNFRVDSPEVALALLVAFHERIMLTEVVTYTRLPAACRSLELVPGILALYISIDGLKVHLARRGR